jgi:outer membrane protein OmpA-like peptidoglycan-associated protein
MPHHGFGTYRIGSGKTKFDFDLNIAASFETGVKWRLSQNEKWFLYTGLFVDFGLTDVRTNHQKKLYEYNPASPANYITNSILDSRFDSGSLPYNDNSFFRTYTDKVNTLAAGIKVQLSFGKKPFSPKGKLVPVVEEKPYEGLTAPQAEDIINRNVNRLIESNQSSVDKITTPKQEELDYSTSISGFELDKKHVLPFMVGELDNIVRFLQKHPATRLLLTGNTDELGSDDYNLQLGLQRAEEVKAYLIVKGINANRLETASNGNRKQILPNVDEARRRINRRVDVILIK